MPTYDYACSACEREFTVEKSITDDSRSPCPRCESEETRRLISRTSFVLKGGGWYEDGYGSSGTSSSGKDSSESDSSGTDSSGKDSSESASSGTDSSGKGTDATATTSTSSSSDD